MKQVVQKKLSVFTFMLFVFMLFIYICVTKTVNADDNMVPLEKWTFTQGGQYLPDEPGNEGYINSVTMNDTKEMITGWLKGGEESCNQTQKAIKEATGFAIDIGNTGWDAQWGESPVRINPWSIGAFMEISIDPRCWYEVSFKARATKNKYAYVRFFDGDDRILSHGDRELLVLNCKERTFKYTIDSYLLSKKLEIILLLGAFDAQYDFEGNDISDIVTKTEYCWSGTVYISDFEIRKYPHIPYPVVKNKYVVTFKDGDTILSTQTILSGCAAQAPSLKKEGYRLSWDQWFNNVTSDLIVNAVWIPNEVEASTDVTETNKIIEKDEIAEEEQTTVTKVKVGKTKVFKVIKAKNSKIAKISLKKIRRASKYQIQISINKKFKKVLVNKKVNKITTFISSKRLKKKKKLYVRARALVMIEGRSYYGEWSSAKKVKIK